MTVNDFDVWQNGAPVLDKGDPEVNTWLQNAPVLDNPTDEETTAGSPFRRRAWIF